MSERKPPGAVEKAVRAELRSLQASVTSDGSAALAVSLAKQIDVARGAVAAAAAAGQLRALLIDLRAAAAERPKKDALDELRERRYGRERGTTASA